ncbi:hypothetical protein VTJ04DRAFT_2730 [Mycothermus thermophilus]|uniref:uncharacterized protein n=1 Tax=Humicola insolens TaxID=85995 RepID=UPI0037434E43
MSNQRFQVKDGRPDIGHLCHVQPIEDNGLASLRCGIYSPRIIAALVASQAKKDRRSQNANIKCNAQSWVTDRVI